jgi:hypothetical protein
MTAPMPTMPLTPSSYRSNNWGPYTGLMSDRLDSCAEYLSRCRRSLDGEIADDRFYFTDKAHELLDAAERLVDGCIDADHWLCECGEEYEADDESGCLVVCALPAGHDGDHEEDPATTAAERAYRDAVLQRANAQRLCGLLATLPWHAGPAASSPSDAAETVGEICREIARMHALAQRLDRGASELGRGTGR